MNVFSVPFEENIIIYDAVVFLSTVRITGIPSIITPGVAVMSFLYTNIAVMIPRIGKLSIERR